MPRKNAIMRASTTLSAAGRRREAGALVVVLLSAAFKFYLPLSSSMGVMKVMGNSSGPLPGRQFPTIRK
jgi:hypothetical protein